MPGRARSGRPPVRGRQRPALPAGGRDVWSGEGSRAVEELCGEAVTGVRAELSAHGRQVLASAGGVEGGIGVEEGVPVSEGLVEVTLTEVGFGEAGAGEEAGAVFGGSAGAQ